MARRGENIYKRKDGHWEGRYKSSIKANGTTKYSSIYCKPHICAQKLKQPKFDKTRTVTAKQLSLFIIPGNSCIKYGKSRNALLKKIIGYDNILSGRR